jgi:hypothetical protein
MYNRIYRAMLLLSIMALLGALSVVGQTTEPEGGVPTIVSSDRQTPASPATSVTVVAGNISRIDLSADTTTQAWAGIYGSITGDMVLENAAGNQLYSWTVASVEGEVYAAEHSNVDFTTGKMKCIADTNETSLESDHNIASTDEDGFGETFSAATTHPAFYVGGNAILASSCLAVELYDETGSSSTDWKEVALWDDTNSKIVYAAIMNDDATSFNNDAQDFQMIVMEDGHAGDEAATAVYLYVELEG